MFISTGLVSTLVGAGTYYVCANRDQPNCDTKGPSVQYYVIGLFVLQIIFVWAAYILLPFSKKKGGRQIKKADDEEPEVNTSQDRVRVRYRIFFITFGRKRKLIFNK
jgi:hypothetical protein